MYFYFRIIHIRKLLKTNIHNICNKGTEGLNNHQYLRFRHQRLETLARKTCEIYSFFLKYHLLHQVNILAHWLKHNKATLIYKALNNKAPDYITNLLKPMSEVHILNLRSTENGTLYVPRSRTSLYDGSFSCSAPRLWNSLPQTVRNAGSLPTFKQSLKLCF